MPVRFSCPHCRQKLSVSSRKAGREANCPRCARTLTIPLVAETASMAGHEAPLAEDHASIAHAAEAAGAENLGDAQVGRGRDGFEGQFDAEGSEAFELVFDTDDATVISRADAHPDLIAVPRLVLYLQGGLLAVVALASFALGMIAGGAFSGGAAPS